MFVFHWSLSIEKMFEHCSIGILPPSVRRLVPKAWHEDTGALPLMVGEERGAVI